MNFFIKTRVSRSFLFFSGGLQQSRLKEVLIFTLAKKNDRHSYDTKLVFALLEDMKRKQSTIKLLNYTANDHSLYFFDSFLSC